MRLGEKGYMVRLKDGSCYGKNDRRDRGPFMSYDVAANNAKRRGGEVVQVELRVLGVMKPVPDPVTNQG